MTSSTNLIKWCKRKKYNSPWNIAEEFKASIKISNRIYEQIIFLIS